MHWYSFSSLDGHECYSDVILELWSWSLYSRYVLSNPDFAVLYDEAFAFLRCCYSGTSRQICYYVQQKNMIVFQAKIQLPVVKSWQDLLEE